MMWSKHSRRIDPISRSAKLFCQGEAGAIGTPLQHEVVVERLVVATLRRASPGSTRRRRDTALPG
jgi:hypothetical protein